MILDAAETVLGFLTLIESLTVISKGIMREGNRWGM
jgi:hypothetical protein